MLRPSHAALVEHRLSFIERLLVKAQSHREFAEAYTYRGQVVQKRNDLAAVVDLLRYAKRVLKTLAGSSQVALVRQNVADVCECAGDVTARPDPARKFQRLPVLLKTLLRIALGAG